MCNVKVRVTSLYVACVASVSVEQRAKNARVFGVFHLDGSLGFPFPKNAQERLLRRLHSMRHLTLS